MIFLKVMLFFLYCPLAWSLFSRNACTCSYTTPCFSMFGECPQSDKTTSRYTPPLALYVSSTARTCVFIGCGGYTSAPGQPGTAPSCPRKPKSKSDVSATIWSSAPWIHNTGGFVLIVAKL